MPRLVLWLLIVALSGCQSPRESRVLQVHHVKLKQAWISQDKPPLCPTPKQMQLLKSSPVQLASKIGYCSNTPIEPTLLAEQLGRPVELRDPTRAQLVIELDPDEAPEHDQSYRLRIEQGKILLWGGDRQGLLHGLATLTQLRNESELPAVLINDWPTFPVRGLHLHTGANSGPTHRRLLKNLLFGLKMNTLVLECQYARWKSHPELWDSQLSIALEQLEQTVALAGDYSVELVPLVQTMSHMGWLYANDQNRQWGDASLHYGMPADNEQTWKVIFDVYQEAIDLFKPRRFHVGFDEIRSLRGLYPGTQDAVEEVTLAAAERVHGYLKDRNIATVMWADMLLHRSQAGAVGQAPSPAAAAFLRRHLPESIYLCDWQYQVEPPNFPELALLAQRKNPLLIATWNHGPTTRAQAGALQQVGGVGVLHTTWPGRKLSDAVVEGTEFHQFVSLIDSAEAAWNGAQKYPGDREHLFRWLWQGRPEPIARTGIALTFEGEKALPAGFGSQPQLLSGVGFVPSSGVTVDEVTDIAIEREVAGIAFLWGCASSGRPGQKIATLELTLADGSTLEEVIRWHHHVDSFDSDRPLYRAHLIPCSESYYLRRWLWENPAGQTVTRVTLRPENDAPSLVLHGLSLIDP